MPSVGFTPRRAGSLLNVVYTAAAHCQLKLRPVGVGLLRETVHVGLTLLSVIVLGTR